MDKRRISRIHNRFLLYIKKGGEFINLCNIATSHQLARELLNKPDGFITLFVNDKEYLISGIKRNSTCANHDDKTMYWILKGEYESMGNVKI